MWEVCYDAFPNLQFGVGRTLVQSTWDWLKHDHCFSCNIYRNVSSNSPGKFYIRTITVIQMQQFPSGFYLNIFECTELVFYTFSFVHSIHTIGGESALAIWNLCCEIRLRPSQNT